MACVVLLSGCQATRQHGLSRAWADVNSLGKPAAFYDQFRTDSFRTPPPATGLPVVETLDFGPSVYDSGMTQPDLIPLSDRINTSADENDDAVFLFPQKTPEHGWSRILPASMQSEAVFHPGTNSANAKQPGVVTPEGAWLF